MKGKEKKSGDFIFISIYQLWNSTASRDSFLSAYSTPAPGVGTHVRKLKERTAAAKSLQSCRTLCDPIDRSPPGYPVPGILQARTLEWVAISFSNA